MKEIIDIIVKNKYIIIFVSIVVILYALGVFEYIFKFTVLVAFVALAVFAGKKVQENEDAVKRFINKTVKRQSKEEVYYYQSKSDDKK